MFKIESYVGPFLMSYLDQYVKLRPEDLQISLWGGDAVFSKLDLRLEAIEQMLDLPVTLSSGLIHELHVHVPWIKLGSEPVCLTINTIECVLRLRNERESPRKRTKLKPNSWAGSQPSGTPEPGYIQSILTRITNNVNVIINNLVLKFVEDDIVLSVNVKSAECYTTNELWIRYFSDGLSSSLRRLIEIKEFTICLDKSNNCGKIECYQDPLLYKSSVLCRLLTDKSEGLTRVQFLCQNLALSLTEAQIPLMSRLVNISISLYYKSKQSFRQRLTSIDSQDSNETPDEAQDWVSWAYSFLPEAGEDENNLSILPPMTVLHVEAFIETTSVVFKFLQVHNMKTLFKPYISAELGCCMLQMHRHDIDFLSLQLTAASMHVFTRGKMFSPGGSAMEKDQVFVNSQTAVASDSSPASINAHYFSSSDLSISSYLEAFPEELVLNKYPSFWFDYVYCIGLQRQEGGAGGAGGAGGTGGGVPEQLHVRLLVGRLLWLWNESVHARLLKFCGCLADCESIRFDSEQGRPQAEGAIHDVQTLEGEVPSYVLSCGTDPQTLRINHPNLLGASCQLLVGRVHVEAVMPMYPHAVVARASLLSTIPAKVDRKCYQQCKFKLSELQCWLRLPDRSDTIVPAFDVDVACSRLLLPHKWASKTKIVRRIEISLEKFALELPESCLPLLVPLCRRNVQIGNLPEPHRSTARSLHVVVSSCSLDAMELRCGYVFQGSLAGARAAIVFPDGARVLVCSSSGEEAVWCDVREEEREEERRGEEKEEQLLRVSLQQPKDAGIASVPAVLSLNVGRLTFCVDRVVMDVLQSLVVLLPAPSEADSGIVSGSQSKAPTVTSQVELAEKQPVDLLGMLFAHLEITHLQIFLGHLSFILSDDDLSICSSGREFPDSRHWLVASLAGISVSSSSLTDLCRNPKLPLGWIQCSSLRNQLPLKLLFSHVHVYSPRPEKSDLLSPTSITLTLGLSHEENFHASLHTHIEQFVLHFCRTQIAILLGMMGLASSIFLQPRRSHAPPFVVVVDPAISYASSQSSIDAVRSTFSRPHSVSDQAPYPEPPNLGEALPLGSDSLQSSVGNEQGRRKVTLSAQCTIGKTFVWLLLQDCNPRRAIVWYMEDVLVSIEIDKRQRKLRWSIETMKVTHRVSDDGSARWRADPHVGLLLTADFEALPGANLAPPCKLFKLVVTHSDDLDILLRLQPVDLLLSPVLVTLLLHELKLMQNSLASSQLPPPSSQLPPPSSQLPPPSSLLPPSPSQLPSLDVRLGRLRVFWPQRPSRRAVVLAVGAVTLECNPNNPLGDRADGRQFQLNVDGLCAYSDLWKKPQANEGVSTENPALQWNLISTDSSEAFPILREMNLQVTLAPFARMTSSGWPTHAVEFNAITPIQLNLSVAVLDLCLSYLSSTSGSSTSLAEAEKAHGPSFLENLYCLCTASQLRVVFYDDGNGSGGGSGGVETSPSECRPFFFLQLWHPFGLLDSRSPRSLLKLSCHEVVLSGSSSENVAAADLLCQSDWARPPVFTVPWIVTGEADADPTSGMTRSLFLFHLNDFKKGAVKLDRDVFVFVGPKLLSDLSAVLACLSARLPAKVARLSARLPAKVDRPSPRRRPIGRDVDVDVDSRRLELLLSDGRSRLRVSVQRLCVKLSHHLVEAKLSKFSVSTAASDEPDLQWTSVLDRTSPSLRLELLDSTTVVTVVASILSFTLSHNLLRNLHQMGLQYLATIEKLATQLKSFATPTTTTSGGKDSPATDIDSVRLSRSWDDLRSGALREGKTIATECDVRPEPGSLCFCVGESDTSINWTYDEPRTLQQLNLQPVPLCVPTGSQKKEVRCQLALWRESTARFVDVLEFFASEENSQSCSFPDCPAARSWRILVEGSPQQHGAQKHGAQQPSFPLSAVTLAGSLSIHSVFNSSVAPLHQLGCRCGYLRLQLVNDLPTFSTVAPPGLPVRRVVPGPVTRGHVWLELSLRRLHVDVDVLPRRCFLAAVEALVGASIIEYQFLRMQHLLDPVALKLSVHHRPESVTASCQAESVSIGVGQGTVHALASALLLMDKERAPGILFCHYLLCNTSASLLTIAGMELPPDSVLPVSIQPSSSELSVEKDSQVIGLIDVNQLGMQFITGASQALHVQIKPFSGPQKMVSIQGLAAFYNLLDREVLVQSCGMTASVPSGKIMAPFTAPCCQFKIGIEAGWSSTISSAHNFVQLIKVKTEGKIIHLVVICKTQDTGQHNRVMVLMVPLFRVLNAVPELAELHWKSSSGEQLICRIDQQATTSMLLPKSKVSYTIGLRVKQQTSFVKALDLVSLDFCMSELSIDAFVERIQEQLKNNEESPMGFARISLPGCGEVDVKVRAAFSHALVPTVDVLIMPLFVLKNLSSSNLTVVNNKGTTKSLPAGQSISLESSDVESLTYKDDLEDKTYDLVPFNWRGFPSTSAQEKLVSFCRIFFARKEENMSVFHLNHAFYLENSTTCRVSVRCVCIPKTLRQFSPPSDGAAVDLVMIEPNQTMPLVSWVVHLPSGSKKKHISFVYGLSVGFNIGEFSTFIELPQPSKDSWERCVPVAGLCLSMYGCYDGEIAYVKLVQKTSFSIVLHNQCSYDLLVAEKAFSTANGRPAEEENQSLYCLNRVLAGSSRPYEPPSRQRHLAKASLQLLFAMASGGNANDCTWSRPVGLTEMSRQLLSVGMNLDVRLSLERIGSVDHIWISPVNRVVVTAASVRNQENERRVFEGKTHFPLSQIIEVSSSTFSCQPVSASIKLSSFRLSLMDESVVLSRRHEILCASASSIQLTVHPVDKSSHSIDLSLDEFQIDNQSFIFSNNYDFPVLLKKQEVDDPFLRLKFSLCQESMQLCELWITLAPLQAAIQDLHMRDLLVSLAMFSPRVAAVPSNHSDRMMPASVNCLLSAAERSSLIHKLKIDAVQIELTVHASLQIFLSLERSQLKFSPLKLDDFWAGQLRGKIISHYVSGALFRAGWLLGSLELLGNPAGLLHSASQGVNDLLVMPYQGCLGGPEMLVSGVMRGMGSFLWHLSTGALNSVTSFSASVSRNMDKLSLDGEHCERQEARRKLIVQSGSGAVQQGLTSFAMSLLSAVAGLADQPLQSVVRTDRSTLAFLSGVGKGLVGIFTKPLGGAAELLTQTGMGILQQIGFEKFLMPVFGPRIGSFERLKFSKLLIENMTGERVESVCTTSQQRGDDENGSHTVFIGVTETTLIVCDSKAVLSTWNLNRTKLLCQSDGTFLLQEAGLLGPANLNRVAQFVGLKDNEDELTVVQEMTLDFWSEYDQLLLEESMQ